MQRPRTSKPRGVCKYYSQPRGCFAGSSCKFLHGDPETEELTPYDKAKVCRFYQQGYCKRGDACWFRHVKADQPTASPTPGPSSEVQLNGSDEICSICFEVPTTYGLLGGCSHVFCITCIRQWRLSTDKSVDVIESGANKKCPMCRSPSRFITPTSHFYPHNSPEKDNAIAAYKKSMQKVKCRYFEESRGRSNGPDCPFGLDCFYLHLDSDGTPHVFTTGATAGFRRQRARLRPEVSGADFAANLESITRSLSGIFSSYVDNHSGDMPDISNPPRADERLEDLAAQRRSVNAAARQAAGIGQMADDILAMIASLPLHPLEAALQNGEFNDDNPRPNAFWSPDDMPSLEPIPDGEENNTDRAIFAEWVAHDDRSDAAPTPSQTSNPSQSGRSITVADHNGGQERLHVGGSESTTSRTMQTDPVTVGAPTWTRLVFPEGGNRWTFGTVTQDTGDGADDDGDLPELLSVSDSESEDGYLDSDSEETSSPLAENPLVSSIIPPMTLSADDSAPKPSTPIISPKGAPATPPEFTTDGRGRVIAASPTGEGESSATATATTSQDGSPPS
ncbi:hypothetical protein ONZ45_g6898 [Pleurotus djamor]|nr:hypothetical protein ONZ45_g6898 [Pleurotus djamor]